MTSQIEQLLTATLHKLEADGSPIPHNRLQKALSKAVHALVPAPHQSPGMEWAYGNWIGSFAAYDEVGRQLGEANVLPEWLVTPLPDTWRPFKGPGIRHGHPFNKDAMHEMVHCWDDLLMDAATLRDLYCRLYQRPDQRLSAADLYMITTVAISIPAFLLRRGDAPPPNGAIPRRAVAAFKVLGGMYAATNRMMSQANPCLTGGGLDVEAFLQYLEDERLLLSPESRACAAPVKMIRQILAATIDPSDSVTVGLPHLGADAERAFAYGCLCARIDLMVLLHWRSLRHYLQPLLHDPATPAAARACLEQEPELGIADDIPLAAYAQVANHIVSLLGASPAEQAWLDALPLPEKEGVAYDTAAIASHCQRLEMAMRHFALAQQQVLDQLLQRTTKPAAPSAWSPAPGSDFLKKLCKLDTRLAWA